MAHVIGEKIGKLLNQQICMTRTAPLEVALMSNLWVHKTQTQLSTINRDAATSIVPFHVQWFLTKTILALKTWFDGMQQKTCHRNFNARVIHNSSSWLVGCPTYLIWSRTIFVCFGRTFVFLTDFNIAQCIHEVICPFSNLTDEQSLNVWYYVQQIHSLD